jgi:alanine racemase
MDPLRAIIHPTIGIFTNVGPAHGENFKSDLEKAKEKAVLFREAQTLVYCRDHAVVREAVMATALDKQCTLRDWSRGESAFVHLIDERRHGGDMRLRMLHGLRELAIDLPFTDKASVENAMHCITLLLHLGHDPEWIAGRVRELEPVAMRLQMLDGVQGSTLINDAYSNDLASLGIALDHLNAIAQERRRVVVLGEIHGSGSSSSELYGRVAGQLERARVDQLLGIGPGIKAEAEAFRGTT